MSPAELLVELWKRGVELTGADGKLRWRAPAGIIDSRVVAAIRAAKPALLPLVESQSLEEHGLRRCSGPCGHIQTLRHFDGAGGRCDECRSQTEQAALLEE